jgi:hypothetical protein
VYSARIFAGRLIIYGIAQEAAVAVEALERCRFRIIVLGPLALHM